MKCQILFYGKKLKKILICDLRNLFSVLKVKACKKQKQVSACAPTKSDLAVTSPLDIGSIGLKVLLSPRLWPRWLICAFALKFNMLCKNIFLIFLQKIGFSIP